MVKIPASQRLQLVAVACVMLLASSIVAGQEKKPPVAMREQILSGLYGKIEPNVLLQTALKTRDPSRREMHLALLLRKKEVLPMLMQRVRTADDEEKYEILMLVQGQLRWREFEPVVIQLLNNKKLPEQVRGRAATALALFQNTEAIPEIRKLLDTAEEDMVRQWTMMALAVLGDEASRPRIEAILKDPSPFVRVTAAMALGILGSAAGLDQALALSRDEFFGLRCRAAEALSYIGTPMALARLREMQVSDESATVRSESTEYLGQAELRAVDKDVAIARLKDMLAPDKPNPPRWAFVYLAEHFGTEARPFLQQLAETAGPLQYAATIAVLQVEAEMVMRPHIRRKN